MIQRFVTVKDAAAVTGLDPHAIRAALQRRNGKSGKWYWMYL